MADGIWVPVKKIGSERWGQLSYISDQAHLICGEDVRQKESQHSFAGEHRVRVYSFKKNVHWRIPEGIPLDIAGVQPAGPARRLPPNAKPKGT
jgi:hypothetical protein